MRVLITAAVILSVVALGGCGTYPAGSSAMTPATSSSAQAGTPTPAATSAPTPIPAATPLPAPGSGATTFQVLTKFNCRLPVRMIIDDQVKGFLDLSTGRFLSDPSAPVGAQSYSWFAHRWLPVPLEMQSPDGTHYAYAASDGIHDVDLTTGVDRNLVSSAPNQVVEYGADGIYVTTSGGYAGNLGLWRLDPLTAALKHLLPVSVAFDSLGGGAAWYSDSRGDGPPSPDTLYRIDLGTGSRTIWFQKPNIWAVHLGTDATGQALVGYLDVRTSDPVTLAVMSGPGQALVIRTGPNATMAWIPSVTDSHGMWFDSNSDVSPLWLLQADDRLVEVAKAPVRPLGACE
jgi:hypothetical protein